MKYAIIFTLLIIFLGVGALWLHAGLPPTYAIPAPTVANSSAPSSSPTDDIQSAIQRGANFHVLFPSIVPSGYELTGDGAATYSDVTVNYVLSTSSPIHSIVVSEKPSALQSPLFATVSGLQQAGASLTPVQINGQLGYWGLLKGRELIFLWTSNGVDIELSTLAGSGDYQTLFTIANAME